ncbi:MAG: methyltransferase domain-containing protein [Desulfobacteraceae bacterium]|nr:MAG: methyltransferase domain-containing protein [Desulfobacteraceae bacterium]
MLAFRKKYLEGRQNVPLLILDLGSLDVNGSYRGYFESPSWTYRGIDMAAGRNVDIVLQDLYSWREIKSASADVMISGQAFEHIEFFWLTMLEIARVLKPDGLCCLIAPSGGPEHRYPVDCWRFYHDGFAALARFASLKVLEIYSQNGTTGYDDGSDIWQDIVLVCRKPVLPKVSLWKEDFRHRLLHKLLR